MSKLSVFVVFAGLCLSIVGAQRIALPVENRGAASAVAVYDPPPVLTERNRLSC